MAMEPLVLRLCPVSLCGIVLAQRAIEVRVPAAGPAQLALLPVAEGTVGAWAGGGHAAKDAYLMRLRSPRVAMKRSAIPSNIPSAMSEGKPRNEFGLSSPFLPTVTRITASPWA
jgi:hypothetical protein